MAGKSTAPSPTNPPKNRKRSRWARRLRRIPAALAFLYIAVWLGANAAVNREPVRGYLIGLAAEYLNGEVALDGRASITPLFNVSLNDVAVRSLMGRAALDVECRSIFIEWAAWGRPRVSVRGLNTPLLAAEAVRFGVVRIEPPLYELTVERPAADLSALLESAKEFGGGGDGGETAFPFERIAVEDAKLTVPWLAEPLLAGGVLELNGGTATGTLAVRNADGPGTARASVSWEKFPGTLREVRGRLDRFRARLAAADASAGFIADGSFELVHTDGGYRAAAGALLRDASFQFVLAGGKAAVGTGGLEIRAEAPLDSAFRVRSASALVGHATLAERADWDFILPPGGGRIAFHIHEDRPGTALADWRFPGLGSLSVSAEWPISATRPSAAAFAVVRERSAESLKPFIPKRYRDSLPAIGAALAATANLVLNGTSSHEWTGEFNIGELERSMAGWRFLLEGAGGTARGGPERIEAEWRARASASWEGEEGRSLRIDPGGPLRGALEYEMENGVFGAEAESFDTEYLKDIRAAYSSGYGWRVEGRFPAAGALPLLIADLVPDLTRDVQAEGELAVSAGGDADSAEVRASGEALTVFSFDEDPFYGAELKSPNLRVEWNADEPAKADLTISAASPVFIHGDRQVDVPDGAMDLRARADFSDRFRVNLEWKPVSGGLVTGRFGAEGGWRLEAEDAGIEKVLLPLLEDLQAVPLESLKTASGRTDLWIEGSGEGGPVRGFALVEALDWKWPALFSLSLTGASLRTPFAYPFEPGALPGEAFELHAERLSIQGLEYRDVNLVFPLEGDSVPLADNFEMPLFGGALRFHRFGLAGLREGPLRSAGQIYLADIEMRRASRQIPYLGREGLLNGEIEGIVWDAGGLNVEGAFAWSVFGGRIILHGLDWNWTDNTIGFSARLENIQLSQLSDYYNYGKITGTLEGDFREVRVYLPPDGGVPKPARFDFEIRTTDPGDKTIGGATLKRLMELGKADMPFKEQLYNRDFRYAALGLRGIKGPSETRLYGTAGDNYFLKHSDALFANKVGIKLGMRDQQIDFDEVWNRLLAQIENAAR